MRLRISILLGLSILGGCCRSNDIEVKLLRQQKMDLMEENNRLKDAAQLGSVALVRECRFSQSGKETWTCFDENGAEIASVEHLWVTVTAMSWFAFNGGALCEDHQSFIDKKSAFACIGRHFKVLH